MISLDRYEKFSETYGNESGGEIVSGFVDIIKDFLRLTDIFACIGGEDFVILLPDTDSKGVKHVADRLREYIEKSTFRVADIDVNITASFGCSEVSKFDTSYDNVVNRSEIALYQAKHFGGNKVSLLDYKSWKK
jgi:diguanylate cyclase (GGDEF)-like protein